MRGPVPATALAQLSDASLYTITASLLLLRKSMSVRIRYNAEAKIYLFFVPYFVAKGLAVAILRESVTRTHHC